MLLDSIYIKRLILRSMFTKVYRMFSKEIKEHMLNMYICLVIVIKWDNILIGWIVPESNNIINTWLDCNNYC